MKVDNSTEIFRFNLLNPENDNSDYIRLKLKYNNDLKRGGENSLYHVGFQTVIGEDWHVLERPLGVTLVEQVMSDGRSQYCSDEGDILFEGLGVHLDLPSARRLWDKLIVIGFDEI